MKQKAQTEKFVVTPQVLFLGRCVDDLDLIIDLIKCQRDSLSTIDTRYGNEIHHVVLNDIIYDRLSGVYGGIYNQLKELRKSK